MKAPTLELRGDNAGTVHPMLSRPSGRLHCRVLMPSFRRVLRPWKSASTLHSNHVQDGTKSTSRSVPFLPSCAITQAPVSLLGSPLNFRLNRYRPLACFHGLSCVGGLHCNIQSRVLNPMIDVSQGSHPCHSKGQTITYETGSNTQGYCVCFTTSGKVHHGEVPSQTRHALRGYHRDFAPGLEASGGLRL